MTYNGENQNFTIENFADTGITLTNVKRTEIDGTETTVYDPSTSTGTCPVSGNILTLKDAGIYTLTFKRPTGEDAADEWDGGDKSETCEVEVKINPLKIAVPTIGNATQTYNTGGCTFNVTGFDNDLMTVTVSDGALWNEATKQFKATNADEYTVSFGLKNKNYVWTGIGTADAQTAKFTIEKKTLQLKWTTQQTSVEDGYFMLPSLDVTYEVQQLVGGVKYYKASECTITGGAVTVSGSAVDISEIEKEQEYYAVVEISDDVKKNYNFTGAAYYHFDTSDGRTIVIVSVTNSGTNAYDDTPHAAKINVVDQTGNSLTPGKDIFIRVIYKSEGDGEYDGEGSTNAPKNAGTYTVVVSIAPNSDVDFRLADSMGFEYVINKADPVLDPIVTNSTGLIAGGLLSELNIIKKASNTKATDGTYVWTAEKLISGNNYYDYTFTPNDTRNYNAATGSYPLSAHDAEITSISATFTLPANEEGEPTVTVYDSWKLDDLKKYITVTGTLNNGETVDVYPEEYSLSTASGKLPAGSCTVTVVYTESIYDTFEVSVTACVLAEISAEFYADRDIFTSTRLADLNRSEWLVVTGTNNDGTPYSGGISGYILSIDGDENATLEVGANTVTVTYWVTGISEPFVAEFTVNDVKAVELDEITANFNYDEYELYKDEITASTDINEFFKRFLSVTGTNNDGTPYDEITADDYTLDGKIEMGKTITITVKLNDSVKRDYFDVEIPEEPIIITKTKLPLPDLSGMVYTGEDINVLSSWSKYLSFVQATGNVAQDADTYVITLKIKDEYFDKYEWDSSSLVKSPLKYALYDGAADVIINGATLTATWTIAPATLKGSWNKQGTLNLSSESYSGSFENVVAYTYYDENGEEVTELVVGNTYTVVAKIVNDNFVADEETERLLSEPHEFTVAAPPATGIAAVWNNIKNFAKANWLWLVIGAAALLFLIILICIIASAKKKKRKREEERLAREEQRRLEEKEEKKREQEERRMEREERMARLNQQQAMPQMMMPQMMPQMPMQQAMPQAAQAMPQAQSVPMAAGGASSSEIAELKAELKAEFLAIKVDQNSKDIAANEIAQLRSEVNAMRNEMTYAKRTDQVTNMPVDTLAEALTVAIKNVLASATQPILAAQPAQPAQLTEGNATAAPAATQVPPDAVMTTVTTTKIDTTKKAASTQAAPSGRTIVRNFVAPMPVDDGRVFDVGGFYTPVDPVTDMGPVDDEKGE